MRKTPSFALIVEKDFGGRAVRFFHVAFVFFAALLSGCAFSPICSADDRAQYPI
jgi:hypothetical protein